MKVKKEEKNNKIQALDAENIDILEQNINEISPSLLKILLKDKTTGKCIYWACDEYVKYGKAYTASKEILPKLIINKRTRVIQPRITKIKTDQQNRTKKSAEVFTPSWVCNEMINHCDEQWFGKPDVFNIQNDHDWTPTKEKIQFKEYENNKKAAWMYYVDTKRLEITCGEGPYLTSRYDTTTGDFLPIEKRIGILDRKLRIVNENTNNEEEWFKWARRAYEATYGYEYQGDNLLLARENLLFTFIDNFKFKFKKEPKIRQIKQIANVIAWNIWQMDGLTNEVPNIAKTNKGEQLELFKILPKKNFEPIFCKIKNWRSNRVYNFKNFKGGNMKFDVVIGNPPYQETKENTSDNPIYNFFMDESYKIGNFVELITPARFLFNAGKTSKDWNSKILLDKNFKILKYEPNSKNIFANTDIKGGIAIHCRNSKVKYGAIEIFTSFKELNSILKKVVQNNFSSFNELIYAPESYKFTDKLYIDYPNAINFISNGHEKDLVSNIFEKFSPLNIFTDKAIDSDLIQIIGLYSKNRTFKYIKRKYVKEHPNLMKYKVILPGSNGSGALGEVLSTPLIGEPLIGHTQTFISIGAFETLLEAENTMKYVKTKFCRTMLGILKITQSNKKETWKYVPLQDFTTNSDIDWSKTIPEIDKQLYKKYNLNQEEIDFIESRIKPME